MNICYIPFAEVIAAILVMHCRNFWSLFQPKMEPSREDNATSIGNGGSARVEETENSIPMIAFEQRNEPMELRSIGLVSANSIADCVEAGPIRLHRPFETESRQEGSAYLYVLSLNYQIRKNILIM